MVNQPIIDIIIPNFNKAKYVKQCLDSIISQTYKNWKIYFIDDNSNDETKEVLKDFENIDNIKIIYLKENKGPSYCRNLGIEQSSSEYLAFMDSDDFWPENKLEIQIKAMVKNDYNFTYTDYFFFFNNNQKKLKKTCLPNFYDYKIFLNHSSMSTSSIIIKKDLLKKIFFKNVEHEDFLFKCDVLRNGELAFKINETHVYYRINKSNRSSNKIKNLVNLWKINNKENNLNLFQNLKSLFLISFNSFKKYGWK